jgi:hypothetical protein
MERFPVLAVRQRRYLSVCGGEESEQRRRAVSGVRKNTGRQQCSALVGERSIGKKAALATPIPVDLCSTEDHGYHLESKAVYERVFTLRPGDTRVKSEHRRHQRWLMTERDLHTGLD